MRYEGKVYRPWIEAESLLIQITLGCTNNKCIFCDMFREKKFGVRKIEDILEDIEHARRSYRHVDSIFLTDGNVLALPTGILLQVLEKISSTFPECRRVSVYAGLNDLRKKSVDQLIELRRSGLAKVYAGLESGDRSTLKRIQKGLTPEQAEEGMARAKAAGIEVLVSIIFGIGGKERSKQHIAETTNLLNTMRPEELAPMALTIQPGTVLAEQVETGEFVQATPLQMLEEEQHLLESLGDFEMFYWGDHANNIVPQKGRLPEAREFFLKKVEHAIANHPVTEQQVLLATPW